MPLAVSGSTVFRESFCYYNFSSATKARAQQYRTESRQQASSTDSRKCARIIVRASPAAGEEVQIPAELRKIVTTFSLVRLPDMQAIPKPAGSNLNLTSLLMSGRGILIHGFAKSMLYRGSVNLSLLWCLCFATVAV